MSYVYQKFTDILFNQQKIVERISKEQTELVTQEPFVTISRDPGSGGKPIAKLLAKKLGFKFYDKKLLNEIAKTSKTREEILKQIDEKTRTQIEDLVHNLLNPEYMSERRYIKYLCKVILSLTQKGKVVILGRGSNFVAPNAFGLNVRITAPYRVCVARAVEYEKVPYHKAREIIRKTIAERAGFVKQYFGKDINNPKYYDITINTTYYSIEQTVEIIIKAFKEKLLKT